MRMSGTLLPHSPIIFVSTDVHAFQIIIIWKSSAKMHSSRYERQFKVHHNRFEFSSSVTRNKSWQRKRTRIHDARNIEVCLYMCLLFYCAGCFFVLVIYFCIQLECFLLQARKKLCVETVKWARKKQSKEETMIITKVLINSKIFFISMHLVAVHACVCVYSVACRTIYDKRTLKASFQRYFSQHTKSFFFQITYTQKESQYILHQWLW